MISGAEGLIPLSHQLEELDHPLHHTGILLGQQGQCHLEGLNWHLRQQGQGAAQLLGRQGQEGLRAQG